MSTRSSSNGPTLSGCHFRKPGNRLQKLQDLEEHKRALEYTIATSGDSEEIKQAQEALRWLRRYGRELCSSS